MDGARRADTRPAYDSYGRSTGTLPTWRNWQRTALVMRRLGVRVPPSAPRLFMDLGRLHPAKNPREVVQASRICGIQPRISTRAGFWRFTAIWPLLLTPTAEPSPS